MSLNSIPVGAVPPRHRQVVAGLGGEPGTAGAAGRVRVVVDLAALDDRRPLVQQAGQRADQPRLALAALTQQDHVVPGDDRALEVRQHGLAESDDARERGLTGAQVLEQVMP